MKILIVDDDPTSRRLLAINLKYARHEIIEAQDGDEGWEIFLREGTRLVITDWMMPEVDGTELIRRIRASGERGYTYIIMLTALGSKPNVVTGLEAGADDYLTKPFDADELLARIKIGERILMLEESLSASKQKMEYLAMHDALTGLLNRRAVQERAEAEVNRSRRNGNPLSFILLDIDHFKSINDRFGHAVGDQALKFVANLLAQQVRIYDLVARWGGEEFLIILPDTQRAEAVSVAERIRQAIATASLKLENKSTVEVTASFGVAFYADAHWTLNELVAHADEALYRAKHEGRNRVCFFADPASAA